MSARDMISDGWQNVVTGLGTTRDKRTAFSYKAGRRISTAELADRFAHDHLTARIASVPAREMTRKWVRLEIPDDLDLRDAIVQQIEDLGTRDAFQQAITWARLYGGGAVFVGIEDGLQSWEPVNEEGIRRIGWAVPLDADELKVATYNTDPESGRFDMPEIYTLSRTTHVRIHHSRLLVFDGGPLPHRIRRQRDGWGASAVERADEAVRDFIQGVGGAAHALTDFAQAAIKIEGLSEMLADDEDGLVTKRLRTLDLVRSTLRMVPLDADKEEFTRIATPLTGIAETLDRLAEIVASAVEMPISILLGRSAAGLNSTGDSEITWFHDTIANQQERLVVAPYRRLVELLSLARQGPGGGRVPEQLSVTPVPLRQLTEKEEAEKRHAVAETDRQYWEMGVLSAGEIRASRFAGESFSIETEIDDSLDHLLEAAGAGPTNDT